MELKKSKTKKHHMLFKEKNKMRFLCSRRMSWQMKDYVVGLSLCFRNYQCYPAGSKCRRVHPVWLFSHQQYLRTKIKGRLEMLLVASGPKEMLKMIYLALSSTRPPCIVLVLKVYFHIPSCIIQLFHSFQLEVLRHLNSYLGMCLSIHFNGEC